MNTNRHGVLLFHDGGEAAAIATRSSLSDADGGVRVDSAVFHGVLGAMPEVDLPTGPIDLSLEAAAVSRSTTWLTRYVWVLVSLDTVALLLGGVFGHLMRYDTLIGHLRSIPYGQLVFAAVPAWLAILTTSQAYDRRILGLGSEEFRRVANAAVRLTAIFAVVAFLLRLGLARGLVAGALPACACFTLLFRYLARRVLHRVRADGAASHRVLVVGDGPARNALAQRLQSNAHCGLRVVGACQPVLTHRSLTSPTDGLPPDAGQSEGASHARSGQDLVAHIRRLAEHLSADTVAVAHSPSTTPDVMRRLAWSLEGTGIDLLVAPALTDIAGPRINIRPVSGLPLLQVAEPQFTGARRLVKRGIDLVASGAGLLLLAPLFALMALLVRMSSPGRVLFRQIRIGRDGKPFTMLKFRSMYADAEQRLAELERLNDHGDGVLFKLRADPRITRIGKYLRRYSLDELPQLINVLLGQMSLVGPRPPLPSEVARYEADVHRRLLVKPGITGLWQVSGRSDLDWAQTVRLDLYYVENWSVALDAEILWKTMSAVLNGSGAR
jgi:exopolysaccharide biosynthesis polyprenyl glycosylphosphotransferase